MRLADDDFILVEGAGWFDVKGFLIRINATDEGVVVDVYDEKVAKTGDFDAALMVSTYALDNDCVET